MRNIIYDFARFVGARIRFYFLKLIGFPKPLKYLEVILMTMQIRLATDALILL